MVTVYATIRSQHEPVLTTLQRRDQVQQTVLFYNNDGSTEALERVRGYCRQQDIPFESIKVDSGDLVETAQRMQRVMRNDGKGGIVFNVTDGNRTLSAAGMLSAILEGAQAVWVPEDGIEIPLPLITTRYDRLLTEAQRRVLGHIADNEGCTQADIRQALDLSKPTVSHHIRSLLRYRLVTEAPDPQDGRRKTLHVIPTVHLLLDDKQ